MSARTRRLRARFRNLTPHAVTVIVDDDHRVTIPPDPAGPARVSTASEKIAELEVDGPGAVAVPVYAETYGEVSGLPDPQKGVWCVVSRMVAQARPDRRDLVYPDTSPASVLRDEGGNIVAVRRLAALHDPGSSMEI